MVQKYNNKKFPFRAPESFLKKVDKSNPQDPLWLQVNPSPLEEKEMDGYSLDPLAECDAQKIPGLLHKYHGRVLITVNSDCPIHCRFCFRRHFKLSEDVLSENNWRKIVSYIKNDTSISEVILSGGEPLLLSAEKLKRVVSDLEKIEHLKYLRIHTRLPIAMPEKISDDLVKVIGESRFKNVVVIHCNHPNELDAKVKAALNKFTKAGVKLLNQSVLLKGVNDDAEVLVALSHKLYGCGVLPYYFHMLDPVSGVAHFAVDDSKAKELWQKVCELLPGYLVPRLVRESPQFKSKHHI